MAVDPAGDVYVTDTNTDTRGVKLDAGSNTQQDLPFADLSVPWGIAVDNRGATLVADLRCACSDSALEGAGLTLKHVDRDYAQFRVLSAGAQRLQRGHPVPGLSGGCCV